MHPLRVVVAVNPSASAGGRSGVGAQVVDALAAAGHDVVPLREPSHEALVRAATAELARGADALVVVGGDGMLNTGVNLVAGTDVPLGLVPSGTGNDMARALGVPHDDAEAATRLLVAQLAQPPVAIDAARVTHAGGTTWFGGTLSAGFDALVNERTNRLRWPKGRRRYDLALLIELVRLKHLSYRLELDGVAREVQGTLVTVGNGQSVGGGMRVLPGARLDDGLLDVLIVERLTRLQFVGLFRRMSAGTHLADPRVHVHRVRRVVVESDDVVAFADGERVGPLPVTVEVVPGALHVLAPIAR
ncbi:diacylglycerol kinase [Frigoribacterium sp. PhB160]|uniref:diacylglycerol kinase family protein n=1 Tax=Frigoribacterium sp. PhB160 TaxID=2485192 RepID=UPI000F49CDAC|nr:diacylglycerol kinase family protein [Frigoribacterium sp. PhB160]ROS57992.1 diacylglycerol kinase [Frigoribacterium sp. PhB160]